MRSEKQVLKLAFALLAVAVMATGCRTHKAKANDTGLIGDGTDIGTYAPGDIPMDGSVRFDTLNRVNNAETAAIMPVYFDYDAYVIPAGEVAKISSAADFLRANPAIVLVVEGNCDERGTAEYNMSLGEYRAQSVREQLVTLGVDAQRIQTASYGEERPADAAHNEGAWAKNRRAEFAFYQK